MIAQGKPDFQPNGSGRRPYPTMIFQAVMKLPRVTWLVLATALALAAVAYAPMLYALPALTVASVLFALASRSAAFKAGMANLAAATFAFAVFEGYLTWQDHAGDGTRFEGDITAGYFVRHPVLGYGPAPGRKYSARKYYGDRLIYDVVYSIGPEGLRITPQPEGTAGAGCVVFFGDSITFGEGVNDHETMPARVAALGQGALRVLNLAFSGYGPHQMLAALESKLLDRMVPCRPTTFIYLTIPAHVARVAGLTFWDKHGPRYVLGRAGKLVRDGTFDNPAGSAPAGHPALPQRVLESRTYQRFLGRGRTPGPQDMELYFAVLDRAKAIADTHYPGAPFHILLWADEKENPKETPVMAERLAAAGFLVHQSVTAIPEVSANPQHFRLSPHDRHPNAEGHRLAAEYVATAILKLPPVASPPGAPGSP